MILCDERFASKNIQQQLSSWLQPYIKHCANFGECAASVTRFFKNIEPEIASIIAMDKALSGTTAPPAASTNSNGSPNPSGKKSPMEAKNFIHMVIEFLFSLISNRLNGYFPKRNTNNFRFYCETSSRKK